MIAINGEKLNIDKPTTDLEKSIKSAWDYLDAKYELSKGKTVVMKLKEEFKRKVILVNSMFLEEDTTRAYPNSIRVAYSEKVYIDGNVNNVVCYETRMKDKEGNYTYSPEALRVTNDTVFSLKDKDFLIFLYMFSHLIEETPQNLNIQQSTNMPAKFYFEDIKKEVKVRMGKLQRANKVFNLVMELNDKDLRRLSATLNISGFDSDIIESLQEQLINLAKEDKKWYEMIIDFTQSHDRIIYEVEEKVALAIKKKRFGFTRKMNIQKKPYIAWVHKKNGVVLKEIDPVLTYPGEKAKVQEIVDYFVKNPEAYNAFLIRTEED